jgi:hypothetical protein
MNSVSRLCFVFALATLASGCAHRSKEAEAASRIELARPPAFLTGPAALLLTNTSGFIGSIQVESYPIATASSSGGAANERLTGELLARGSKFFFVPEQTSRRKRAGSGGISFIWDAAESKGFVLSEALQGYAPISSARRYTNIVTRSQDNFAAEKIAGHVCQRVIVLAQAADGANSSLDVWRALELQEFPLRIVSTNFTAFDLRFSKIDLQSPAADLFSPPNGFTSYQSLEAMMNELAARQHDIRRTGLGPPGPPPELQEPGLRPPPYRP